MGRVGWAAISWIWWRCSAHDVTDCCEDAREPEFGAHGVPVATSPSNLPQTVSSLSLAMMDVSLYEFRGRVADFKSTPYDALIA
jgi:hypothetical protein